jgi:hypothetical protein
MKKRPALAGGSPIFENLVRVAGRRIQAAKA